jgi:hypothetical protein
LSQQLEEALKNPGKLELAEPIEAAVAELRGGAKGVLSFHWELEFPEVSPPLMEDSMRSSAIRPFWVVRVFGLYLAVLTRIGSAIFTKGAKDELSTSLPTSCAVLSRFLNMAGVSV